MYNRKELKKEAKQMLRSSVPHFMLVALVYYLLTGGLRLVSDQVSNLVSMDAGVVAFFLSMLIVLFGYVMTVGFSNYALRLSRKQETGMRSLFDSFSYAGRSIGVTLLVAIYTFLWTMLLMFGLGIVTAFVFLALEDAPGVIVAWVAVLYVIALVFVVVIALRYTMAPFALVEAPEQGVNAAVRRSVKMVRGNKRKLFVLELSFVGWELLIGLVFGAVLIVGFFVSDTGWFMGAFTAAMEDLEQMTMVFDALGGQMNLWTILAEVLCIPLTLWVASYRMAARARFYNYVSGYDYCMANGGQTEQREEPAAAALEERAVAPESAESTAQQPVEPPVQPPMDANTYYTPAPKLDEPDEEPEEL